MEILRSKFAVLQAEANLELQKYNINEVKRREVVVRENELKRTDVQIDLRRLVSPIDGMVVGINAAEGEFLREGDVVIEIAKFDTLWATIKVNVKDYAISDLLGKSATVRTSFNNGVTETWEGKVVFCPPNVDAGDTFDVNIEIQNRPSGNFWRLQPGMYGVGVEIHLE
jgi:multidrug efflux pump subunit AcrA (membrane-fusion protein)